jgi:hypothetical protein
VSVQHLLQKRASRRLLCNKNKADDDMSSSAPATPLPVCDTFVTADGHLSNFLESQSRYAAGVDGDQSTVCFAFDLR